MMELLMDSSASGDLSVAGSVGSPESSGMEPMLSSKLVSSEKMIIQVHFKFQFQNQRSRRRSRRRSRMKTILTDKLEVCGLIRRREGSIASGGGVGPGGCGRKRSGLAVGADAGAGLPDERANGQRGGAGGNAAFRIGSVVFQLGAEVGDAAVVDLAAKTINYQRDPARRRS